MSALERAALGVRCPLCNARPMQTCHDGRGHNSPVVHVARLDACARIRARHAAPETYLGERGARYSLTGEFRPPRAGEFYLSGAMPYVYRAPNDYGSGTAYHICRPVEMQTCPCCNGTGQTVKG